MFIQLENLSYQQEAITAATSIFEGTERNTFDNAHADGVRFNACNLTDGQLAANMREQMRRARTADARGNAVEERDACIEMETGTGKTLVYLRTIYELYRTYGFTKFIILVPSVPVREGVLSSFSTFQAQLAALYGFTPHLFEYDSKKLPRVMRFIEEQHPQVMVMTVQSFLSEEAILNRAAREDLFNNLPFIDAIAKTRPIIIMDEPQEGMDTDKAKAQIARLNPLFKLRYSATHRVVRNLLFRLTPYDAYRQGLVKTIEVLSVTEKGDEATMKIFFEEAQVDKKQAPKVKLRAWKWNAASEAFKLTATPWLKPGDDLAEKTSNPSYAGFRIERIHRDIDTGLWQVAFANGTAVVEGAQPPTQDALWAAQLKWLVKRHFQKKTILSAKGIKCLSLVFIDRVANYMGPEPVIKNLFEEAYREYWRDAGHTEPLSNDTVAGLQGYYFSKTSGGEYTDDEGSIANNREMFRLILEKSKTELLDPANPVEFIFSHSALGVGWDNPNVFNIATLSNAYSEVRKRQEIGRGLRLCIDGTGARVHDAPDTPLAERINLLTVVPNESYHTFVAQYQDEIQKAYGSAADGARIEHNEQGTPRNHVQFTRRRHETADAALQRFWQGLARRTEYVVAFEEEALIEKCATRLQAIVLEAPRIEIARNVVEQLHEGEVRDAAHIGTATERSTARFAPMDLVEELSEATGLAYPTVFAILSRMESKGSLVRNPPRFLQEATRVIRAAQMEEMVRLLRYEVVPGENPLLKDLEDTYTLSLGPDDWVATPNRGAYDKAEIDSGVERGFAQSAEAHQTGQQDEVVALLKLPRWYKVPIPKAIGGDGYYEPDWAVVLHRRALTAAGDAAAPTEHYFVVETKSTHLIDDPSLQESERLKIRCAQKHFEALGLDVSFRPPVHYAAPIDHWARFLSQAAPRITDDNNATTA